MNKIGQLFTEFFESDKAGGFVLIFAPIVSFIIANSHLQTVYSKIWSFSFADHSIVHRINDGLKVIFFLPIGLELECEIYSGELSQVKKASLPIFALANTCKTFNESIFEGRNPTYCLGIIIGLLIEKPL